MSNTTGEITSLNIETFGNAVTFRTNTLEADTLQARTNPDISLNDNVIPAINNAYVIGNGSFRLNNVNSTTSTNDIIQNALECYINGNFVTGGVISPTSISTTPQNDYNPTGLANASVVRLTSTINIQITGFAGGINGRRLTLVNIGSFNITLMDQNTSSAAANRFTLGGINSTLVSGSMLQLIYDGVVSRWRVQSGAGGGSSGGLVQTLWSEITTDTSTSVTTWPVATTTIRSETTLPNTVIPITSRTGFTTVPNTVRVLNSAGQFQLISYTGTTGGGNPTLTGASGGTGSLPVGAVIRLYPPETTIAIASNGASLPQATINVASTTSFPASGTILVTTSLGTQLVTYSGTTATTFTGCTGGSGTMSTGGVVRDVTATAQDLIRIEATTQGGSLIILSSASIVCTNNQIVYNNIIVDNLRVRGGAASGNGSAPGGSAVIGLRLTGIPAGDHVITLQWRVSGGTASVTPVSNSEVTNANMLVLEVAA